MSKFEEIFRLWMAGFGVKGAEADKICAEPLIAMSIKAGDAGGIVQDLDRFTKYGSELHTAINDPMEQLILLCAFK